MIDPIERRKSQREPHCRGCDDVIPLGEEMISTYSSRNRGQYIYFCLSCAKQIGDLAHARSHTSH